MINCKEEEDGSFTITWDENDPVESVFNTWTKEDFENAISAYITKLMEEENESKSKDN